MSYIRNGLKEVSHERSQMENVKALNSAIVQAFNAEKIEVEYAGPYGILPEKPLVSNPLVASYGHGCTDIDLNYGIIGMAIRNRTSVYVPSVINLEEQDPDAHHECRKLEKSKREDMAEFVFVLQKRTKDGRLAVQETYDLDIKRANVLSERGANDLERIIVYAMDICFPEETITYAPVDGLHVRPVRQMPSD